MQGNTELEKITAQVTAVRPYKVSGDHDTYSQYNEGWEGACDAMQQALIESEHYKRCLAALDCNGALLDALISQAKQTEIEYLTRIERTFDVKPQGKNWQRFLTDEARAVLVAGGKI